MGYKNGSDASLVLPPSGLAHADVWFARLRLSRPPEGTSHPGLDQVRGNLPMRVPVVDVRGIPVMPCTPPKARALLKAGQARPKRNKLGIFYLQLTYEQAPTNQPLVLGIDPGAKFEGFSVVGTKATVLNLMVEAPAHVKKAVENRRTLRRARRFRLWRRPCRHQNRLAGQQRLPPSTRSRWEAKARIVRQFLAILPLTAVECPRWMTFA